MHAVHTDLLEKPGFNPTIRQKGTTHGYYRGDICGQFDPEGECVVQGSAVNLVNEQISEAKCMPGYARMSCIHNLNFSMAIRRCFLGENVTFYDSL